MRGVPWRGTAYNCTTAGKETGEVRKDGCHLPVWEAPRFGYWTGEKRAGRDEKERDGRESAARFGCEVWDPMGCLGWARAVSYK